MYTVLRWISISVLWALPTSIATVACSDPPSATDLHPEGPPMIQQVRLRELYTLAGTEQERIVFAFGTHPDATDADEHAVMTAKPTGNKLRIIMDELLRGNNLEEIACRTAVDEDAFARVPLGATPDDIARCAVPQDVLTSRCPGSDSRSVCLCARDEGCPAATGSFITPKGASVGVLDRDMDGAADQTRFVAGAVTIQCGSIAVPTELDMSYWTPSGNQQKPAQGGFDALGPAIVLVPQGALPVGADCGLVFSPDVVDKDAIEVCAPADGDITQGCTPGDTSAVHFKVGGMTFTSTILNATGVSLTAPVVIEANVPLDPTSLANLTVAEGPDPGTPYTQFTAMLGTDAASKNKITIQWTAPGLAPNTRYTITVPTTVTDVYHQPASQPFVFPFTTGAM